MTKNQSTRSRRPHSHGGASFGILVDFGLASAGPTRKAILYNDPDPDDKKSD